MEAVYLIVVPIGHTITIHLAVTALAVACKSIQTSKLVLDIEMWKLRSKYVSKVVLDCEK